MATSNPFKNYEPPAAPKTDPASILRLQRKGDWFTIEVTEVGELFKNPNFGTSEFTIKGKLVVGELRDYETDTGEIVPAPKAGDTELVYFFPAVAKDGRQTRDERILQAVLAEQGVKSLVPGDLFSASLVEIKAPKQTGWKGERVRGYLVDPKGDRSANNDDPFNFGD